LIFLISVSENLSEKPFCSALQATCSEQGTCSPSSAVTAYGSPVANCSIDATGKLTGAGCPATVTYSCACPAGIYDLAWAKGTGPVPPGPAPPGPPPAPPAGDLQTCAAAEVAKSDAEAAANKLCDDGSTNFYYNTTGNAEGNRKGLKASTACCTK